jgi:hypothetical protein
MPGFYLSLSVDREREAVPQRWGYHPAAAASALHWHTVFQRFAVGLEDSYVAGELDPEIVERLEIIRVTKMSLGLCGVL